VNNPQYFKEGRALRIETVINDPNDLGVLRRIVHLDELVGKARAVNRRLLDGVAPCRWTVDQAASAV